MASFADLLNPKSREVFDLMVAEKQTQEERRIQEQENKRRKIYEENGFKTFDEMIQYLQKSGRRVYFDFCDDHGIYIQWDDKSNKICHQVYENDDIDMTVGYWKNYYTIDEFIARFKNKASGKERINKWGYIDDFVRDEKHPVEKYKNDDKFHFYL